MSTIKDVVNVLKQLPQLKHIKTKKLTNEINKLIASCNSDLIHVKTTNELVPLEKYYHKVDEYGERDEDVIDIYYKHTYYPYWMNHLVKQDDKVYFEIETLHCKCPLCGKKIVLKYIGGQIIEGGYSCQYYKGVDNQAMCIECSNKIEKGN